MPAHSKRTWTLVVTIVAPAFVSAPPASGPSDLPEICAGSKPVRTLGFEPNLGQMDPATRFMARGSGFALALSDQGGELALQEANSNERFVLGLRGGTASKPIAQGTPKGRANYLRGADSRKWIIDVPVYPAVTYKNVRPGVDLVFHGEEGRLEYDFVVAPEASIQDVTLEVSGSQGLALDASGGLLVRTRLGFMRQPPPKVYQDETSGTRRFIEAGYRLADSSRVAFTVASYDRTRPLVIDPVLVYSTYIGGSSFDNAKAVAVDASGGVYLAGFTTSANFPIKDSIAPIPNWSGGAAPDGSTDAFVAKFDPTGTDLVYATYLGGSLEDSANALAVDPSGGAYVTGSTGSTDFPTTRGAFQATNRGAANVFVAKLAPDGRSLTFSTYLGGSGGDAAQAIAIDSVGSAYVAGFTQSPDFPLVKKPSASDAAPLADLPTYQSTLMGAQNAFVAKLSPDGTSLLASTYLGGSGNDAAGGLAIDPAGGAYVAGYTQSADFPHTPDAYQPKLGGCTAGPACSGGAQNAFVSKLAPTLVSLEFSTFLGGSGQDAANALALDASGNIYAAGSTTSSDFPAVGAYQRVNAGAENAFVSKLSADGHSLVYSTFLGGSASDFATSLALDSAANAYVVGQTRSRDFPLVGAFETSNLSSSSSSASAFVTILGASGRTLLGSTFFGGEGGASGQGIALGIGNVAWVVGGAGAGLPTKDALFAYTAQPPVGQNAFLAEVSPEAGTPSADSSAPDAGMDDAEVEASSGTGGTGVIVSGPSLASMSGGSSGGGCGVSGSGEETPSFLGGGLLVGAAWVMRRRRASAHRLDCR